MLNPGLDLSALARTFKEKRRIAIHDFLDARAAEKVRKSIPDLEKRKLWYRVEHGNPAAAHELSYRLWRFPLKNMKLSDVLQDSRRDLAPPKLLDASPEEELDSSHPLRELSEFLNSKACHDVISAITSEALTPGSVRCYASQYLPGDYLGSHEDDRGDKKVAFVLNFTSGWVPVWGGNLFVLDPGYGRGDESIVDTYMNRFNSIVLMEVPLLHGVLPVSNHAQMPRHAVSGWFRRV